MGGTTNMIAPSGETVAVSDEAYAHALDSGYRVESTDEGAARVAHEGQLANYSGTIDTIKAGALGVLRGASLGLTDLAGDPQELRMLREAHPDISTAGQLIGAVGPAFAAPESLLRATPAGAVASLGSKIAEFGEGGSVLARIGATAAAGATEGALQNAGQYVSDVALGDKPLSAEGFVGAMGQGALWGGVSAGALTLGSEGMTAARRLFPSGAVTETAVKAAEQDATTELSSAVADGDALQSTAQEQLRQTRQQKAAMDLQLKARLDEVKVQRARELANVDVEARRAAKGATSAPRAAFTPTVDAAAAAAPPADDLMAALQGTKAKIDAGESIGGMAARAKPGRAIEDAMNDVAAQGDAQMQKLVTAERDMDSARDKVQAWIEKYKNKSGARYVANEESGQPITAFNANREKYVPGAATAEERAAMAAQQDAYMATRPTLAENILSGKRDLGDIIGLKPGQRAQQILDASNAQLSTAGLAPLDEHITQALRARVADWSGDMSEAGQVIGNYERANAALSDAVGSSAPPGAAARAAKYNDAVQAQAEGQAAKAGQLAQDAQPVAEMAASGTAPAAAAKGAKGLLSHASDAATALQALQMMGVPVPNLGAIPVVGPVLSAFLKARVLSKVFRRIGGRIPETAETAIAAKAAATKARAMAAVDKMLAGGARVTKAAALPSAAATAVLAHALFTPAPGPDGQTPYTTVKKGDPATLYQARAEELAQAAQPNAIRDAVAARVKTSDPELLNHIVETIEGKLSFLSGKLVKPDAPAQLGSQETFTAARSQIQKFARYVEAVEDPAGVLERAASGGAVTVEQTEAIAKVYPAMFAATQQRLLEKVTDRNVTIPYAQRVQLSTLFQLPLDRSMAPEYAAFLQQGYQATPLAPQPPAPPGVPTIHAPINTGDRMMTDLDRRSAGVGA